MAKIYQMMKQEPNVERGAPLGLFSYLTMATVLELEEKDQAYGLKITQTLIDRLGTLIDPGQVYLTLKRLDARQLLKKGQGRNGEGAVVTKYLVTADGRHAMAKTNTYIKVAAAMRVPTDERGTKVSRRQHG